tara:strand:+ start:28 stop:183 length:156 start_codon:yes stop_codon:yes gene_type:complete
MDVDCSQKPFMDVAVGNKNFNEFEDENTTWKDPNRDSLIFGIMDEAYAFIN